MKNTVLLSASLVAIAICGMASTAYADSSDAMCEVRKDGQTKQGKSGPCTFSQRQGYIDLDLRNGQNYSLSPGNQPNHFKDQKGNKVVRTQAGGNTQEFKWEGGTKIVVTFGGSTSSSSGGGSDVSSNATSACMAAINGNYGGKVRDLKVVRSQFSQANSEVIVDAVGVRGGSTTERWKCLVSNDGQVQDLAVVPR